MKFTGNSELFLFDTIVCKTAYERVSILHVCKLTTCGTSIMRENRTMQWKSNRSLSG